MHAFGFLAGGYFNLATAMVFGLNTSASSWEPFCCAIEALSVFFAKQKDLVNKHRKYLDTLLWANYLVHPPDLARAIPCSINKGILNNQVNKVILLALIYVNNALVLASSKACMEQVLATLIKAIFVVMGKPDTDLH
jgi:hypothetical protein